MRTEKSWREESLATRIASYVAVLFFISAVGWTIGSPVVQFFDTTEYDRWGQPLPKEHHSNEYLEKVVLTEQLDHAQANLPKIWLKAERWTVLDNDSGDLLRMRSNGCTAIMEIGLELQPWNGPVLHSIQTDSNEALAVRPPNLSDNKVWQVEASPLVQCVGGGLNVSVPPGWKAGGRGRVLDCDDEAVECERSRRLRALHY